MVKRWLAGVQGDVPPAVLAWSVGCAAAVLSGSFFLGTLHKAYLVLGGVSTLVMLLALLSRGMGRRGWPLVAALAMVFFLVMSHRSLREIAEVDRDWEGVSAALLQDGLDGMLAELERSRVDLIRRAAAMLDAPADLNEAFRHASRLADLDDEKSVILYRTGQPPAWSGVFRTEPDLLPRADYGVAFAAFHVVMYASARGSDGSYARAAQLLQAYPPADQLSSPLERRVAQRTGTAGYSIVATDAPVAGSVPFVVGGDTLALVVPRPLVQGQVRLRLEEGVVARGAGALAVAALLFLAVVWRRSPALAVRIVSVVTLLAAIAVIPLARLSGSNRLFDASIYYSPLAGPFTANAGSLLISGSLVLLALLAMVRGPSPLRSRRVALWMVLGIAVLGPFLLRDLARGIAPPVWGSSTGVWLALQGALFVASCSVLVAGASAGRALPASIRRLAPGTAVVVALGAAAIGPVVLDAPGRYPGWYPMLWIVAIAALALARPVRGLNLAAAAVAALGAATLVWYASIKQRVALAERDMTSAVSVDPIATTLMERFGRTLMGTTAPRDRADLLRAYVNSDLASTPYPMELFAWDGSDRLRSQLSLSRITTNPQLLVDAVRMARTEGRPVQQQVSFIPGAQILLAVPHANNWVTAALLAPRSRLVTDEPFLSLVGITTKGEMGDAPYTITLSPVETRGEARYQTTKWTRVGNELHGDVDLLGDGSSVRVHVEVDLRGYFELLQRGTLVFLLDILLFLVLWSFPVAADGVLARWLRARRHLWAHSFRARLTVALFGFFVLPATVFAFWAHRGVLAGERQARELLLNEMLRAAEAEVASGTLGVASERLEAPLFLYEHGQLAATSDSLFLQLSPLGWRLPPDVYRSLELGGERAASFPQQVGDAEALVGYRLVRDPNLRRVVLAAPARTDHAAIEERRRDLGVLLMFATAVGALAALMLSGIAARQLARPIGILRGAALAIARGERDPILSEEPRSEFATVFAAFRTMAADLSATQADLVAAQQRIEAILRNVASGVVAFTGDGRVTLANPKSTEILGVRLEAGAELDDAMLQELAAHVHRFLECTEDDVEFDLDLHGRQLHGWLTRLTSGDGGAVLTLDDVSDLARAQRVIAWGQMARQVAHEIKNPLTPIRLGVQHLKRARTDKRSDFDQILDSNVARILAEIDRLDEIARAFSRYGVPAPLQPDVTPVDVGGVVRDVVALERMGESGVEWRYEEGAGSLLGLASADELREVLLNILENSRAAGASIVRVKVDRIQAALKLEVSDNGQGIPGDILPRIFEPHFSTRSSGSGLGLAITRKLIKGWGGEIGVTSAEGTGTTVTILLQVPPEP